MFYAHLLMSKRGPLAKVWLAAHWEKKLTKAHVFECNLETSVQSIISPKVKIALRTSGHLLLGIVRIYHRKAKYLLADCTEALLKIKMSFRPGLIDLPRENQEATYNAITLPEEFHDFDSQLPDLNVIDIAEYFALNQSRVEEITLREDYGSNILLQDDGFGEEPELLRRGSMSNDNLQMSTSESLLPDQSSASPLVDKNGSHIDKDGFGDEGTGDMLDALLSGENEGIFADLSNSTEVHHEAPVLDNPPDQYAVEEAETSDKALPAVDYTTLLQNEEEGFALEPVDASVVSFEKKRTKRRRKLLVDEVKELSSSNIRDQINNSKDLVAPVDIAPPTKKLMIWKESGGVDYLLSNPGQCLVNPKLNAMFTKCLTFRRSNIRSRSTELKCDMEETMNKPQISDVPLLEDPDSLKEMTEAELPNFQTTSKLDEHTEDKETSRVDDTTEMLDSGETPVELPVENTMSLSAKMREKDSKHSTKEEHAGNSGEENKWNKRTRKMLQYLRGLHKEVDCFSLLDLCRNSNRKKASANFYSFLVLKKHLALELHQDKPYADIIATPGPKFHTM